MCAARQRVAVARMGLRGHPVVLYSGTLGLKHDPSILALIAEQLRDSHPDGPGRGDLRGQGPRLARGLEARARRARQPRAAGLPALRGPARRHGERRRARGHARARRVAFSVPSKVLTYLCSGRAIVGVLPPDNSVAEILLTHGAGLVVDPAVVTTSPPRWPGSSTTRRVGGRWAGPGGATPSGPSVPRRRPTASSRSSATWWTAGASDGPMDRMRRMDRWLPADKQCVTW